jgi:hypothetical protein
MELLATQVLSCGRTVSRTEIEAAVRNAKACAWLPNGKPMVGSTLPKPKWPAPDSARIACLAAKGFGLFDLWEASPVRLEDNLGHAEEIIPRLFPGNPLLCCGWSQSRFDTRPMDDWRRQLSELQFIVPSPMSARTGVTRDGRTSTHTLSNTGPRRFLVCEFDSGDVDSQSGRIRHLAQFAPLVCALSSGGKSLHGWFLVSGHAEEHCAQFFRLACILGADPATWTRSQFVRMPDGRRDNGNLQTVHFLNFRATDREQLH